MKRALEWLFMLLALAWIAPQLPANLPGLLILALLLFCIAPRN